ncbi:MAG: ParA family protein [Candidatus Thiodiazotropha endolucinida]
MAKIFGVVSTKGGVGKTSVCANLGGILADMGQRVLLIDGDFQQTLSSYFEIKWKAPNGLSALIMRADPTNCISETTIDNLDIVLSDDPAGKLTEWYRESAQNVYYLKAALKHVDENYDYVLIDSQGARGIMQQAIILASDVLISPIIPDVLESREFMRGTIQMLQSLEPPPGISIPMPSVPPLHGLIYRQDRTNNAVKIATTIRKQFYNESKGKISILNTWVPYMSAYKKASAAYLPVHRVEVRRSGPTPSAHETFLALAHELLPHLADTFPHWKDAPNRLSAAKEA